MCRDWVDGESVSMSGPGTPALTSHVCVVWICCVQCVSGMCTDGWQKGIKPVEHDWFFLFKSATFLPDIPTFLFVPRMCTVLVSCGGDVLTKEHQEQVSQSLTQLLQFHKTKHQPILSLRPMFPWWHSEMPADDIVGQAMKTAVGNWHVEFLPNHVFVLLHTWMNFSR